MVANYFYDFIMITVNFQGDRKFGKSSTFTLIEPHCEKSGLQDF